MLRDLSVEQQALLDKGIMTVYGEITTDTLDYFEIAMIKLAIMDNPDVEIWFASGGGDADISLCIYDILRLYPGVITAHVMSYAYSSAAIILQACDYRTAHSSSKVMYHNTTYTKTYDYDEICRGVLPDKAKKVALEPQQRFLHILREVTGMSLGQVRKFLREEQRLSAKEALKMGLLDEIL